MAPWRAAVRARLYTKFVAACSSPLILGLAAMATRDDRARLRRDLPAWFAAGLAAVALVAPWFAIATAVPGRELQIAFQQHVVTRFTAALNPTHVHPWSYYVLEMSRQLRESGTLSVTVVGLLLLGLAAVRDGRREAGVILAWFVVPVGIISMLSPKLYHYAYPFVPPLAIAAGYAVMVLSRWRGSRRRRWPACWDQVRRPHHAGARPGPASRSRSRRRCCRSGPTAPRSRGPARARIRSRRFATVPRGRSLRARAGGSGPPGVWAEGAIFSQSFGYYLKDIGPFQSREVRSDPTVYMHLYAPSHFRPVLLSRQNYESLTSLSQDDTRQVIERAARKAGLEPSVLAESVSRTPVGGHKLGVDVMLLPGLAYAPAAR